MRIVRRAALALTVSGLALAVLTLALGVAAMPRPAAAADAHMFRFAAIEGGEIDLASFRGKPVLVVNTASLCGYADQLGTLQELYDAYGGDLVVLGVPSDDFRQELSTGKEAKAYCEVNFGVTYPMTEITHVRGTKAHPFYRWAKSAGGASAEPRWNFHKLLIGPGGEFVAAFPTATEPDAPAVRAAIDTLLSRVAG